MDSSQHTTTEALLEQLLVDALLLRYRNIVELAILPEGEAPREVAAAQAFQMKVETQALVRAAEDLLKLTRELKELWLFEPLRGLNEGEAEVQAKIDEDARKVGEMVDSLLSMRTNGKA